MVATLPRRTMRVPVTPLLVLACAAFTLAAAVATARFGPGLAAVPVAALALAGMVVRPREALTVLLVAGFALDPVDVGPTGALAGLLWAFPESIDRALPMKLSPFEVYLALLAARTIAWPDGVVRPGLPRIVLGVPLVIILGMAVGFAHGAPHNLVYHEARGLIFACLAFVAAWRSGLLEPRRMALALAAASAALAVDTILRATVFLLPGRVALANEFWFAHETALFLGIGSVAWVAFAARTARPRDRWLALGLALLMAAAGALTGRRSAILVLLVGVAVVAWLLFPRRPLLVTAAGLVLATGGAIYLQAYWDGGRGGPMAEPARAIRSQFDPGERDASSDAYRETERQNLQRTIRESPVLGIGFGRPFTEYEPLPELDFWPLQRYTPHQNILWVWLKTGLLGIAVILGTWFAAFRRALTAARAGGGARSEIPLLPIVLAATLAMYLVYARVDLALPGSRAAVPLAIAIALAFRCLPAPGRKQA